MDFTQEQIRRLAKLSGLSYDESMQSIWGDLVNILAFFEKLDEVDADKLASVTISSPLVAPLREDRVIADAYGSEDLLSNSSKKIVNRHIAVDSILHA
jgi:aspartyl/glutamyl-tRNA(Asn/Gln) amidotransferase C subunit